MNLRDSILGCDDTTTEAVHVPEWNTTVYVRAVSVAERHALTALVRDLDKQGKDIEFELHLMVATVVDQDGNRVFTTADLDALRKKSGAALHRLVKVATRLAGFDRDVDAEAKNS